jgi:hypothetical protein
MPFLSSQVFTQLMRHYLEAQIEYIKDLKQMALYGVFKTPALWVDGSVVSQGKVLSVDEIKQILTT